MARATLKVSTRNTTAVTAIGVSPITSILLSPLVTLVNATTLLSPRIEYTKGYIYSMSPSSFHYDWLEDVGITIYNADSVTRKYRIQPTSYPSGWSMNGNWQEYNVPAYSHHTFFFTLRAGGGVGSGSITWKLQYEDWFVFWDADTGTYLRALPVMEHGEDLPFVLSLDFSPDGRMLAVGIGGSVSRTSTYFGSSSKKNGIILWGIPEE